MTSRHLESFRRNVRLVMDVESISLRQLATQLGTSHTYVYRLLADKLSPSLSRCEQIADCLGIPLPQLIQKNFKWGRNKA